MIQSHIYARLETTEVFSNPAENGKVVHTLHKGDWLGILSRHGSWMQVIGVECEGWVRSSDVENRPPFQLHIQMTEGKPISYVSFSVNAEGA